MDLNITETSVVALIQLSLVPVFLLVGIGQMLGVVTGRLARVIDRARWFASERKVGNIVEFSFEQSTELNALRRRMRFANWAINFLTAAALLVCCTVILLLLNGLLSAVLDAYVLGLFVFAMASITGGLICFFVEVSVASATLRIPEVEQ